MKGTIGTAAVRTARQRLLRWSGHSAVEVGLHCFGALAAAFLLAGIRVGGSFLPLSVSLSAALGLGLPSFGAYVGGCLGYVVFFGADTAMEPMAVGLLVEACLCIFGEELSKENRWFSPACVMLFSGLVGVLFLLQSRFSARLVWRWLLRVGAGGLGADCFRRALAPEQTGSRLILPVCLCAGLCAVKPLTMPLGAAVACGLAAAAAGTPAALQAAVLLGLAVDLCWSGGNCTMSLTMAALGCRWLSHRWWRLGLWLAIMLLSILLTGSSYLLLAAAVLGTLLSPLVPVGRLFGETARLLRQTDPRLSLASGLLGQLSQCLSVPRSCRPDPETNAVFDQAADRVCRHCSLWDTCWESGITETCKALNLAAPAMMTRGKVLREDLPAEFTERCRHMEGFLTAVNRELDDLSCRRQYRSRLRESRAVLAQQYNALSTALAQNRPEGTPLYRFQAELGFRSLGRKTDTLSGDRGASFRVGKWFYLLLCDGMGTGTAASAEAGAAIGILRTLLQSGVTPSEALQMLNGIYILRDDGGFATVDLLQADLETGAAQLFKWGGAPSYLKKKGVVEKIGTASPPPGLGVGEGYRPEGEKLSLARGEMLVLVSDGAGGEAAERFIRQYGGLSPKELASGIVSCSRSQGEDDRTAAVLTLRPRLSM